MGKDQVLDPGLREVALDLLITRVLDTGGKYTEFKDLK